MVYLYGYDAAGELTSQTDPASNVTTYAYDALGRQTTVTAPSPSGEGDGLTTTYAYDLVGNLLSQTDPLGHATSYTYNDCNEQATQTDADGGVTTYTFDKAGNTLSLTDPDGNETQWTYDALNRVIRDTDWVGTSSQVSSSKSYDLAGDLVQTTDFDGRVIDYVYDHLGRETHEKWMSGSTIERTMTFGYDGEGNMTSAADVAPQTSSILSPSYRFTYDGSGNVLQTTINNLPGLSSSFHLTLVHTWDFNGNLATLSATVGSTPDFKNTYAYNSLGQIQSVTQSGQYDSDPVATKTVAFGYDADARLSTIDRYVYVGQGEVQTLVAHSLYTYDGDSNLTGLADTDAAQNTLAGYTWTPDAAGRITQSTSIADGSGGTPGTAAYTYDNDNQLLTATYSNYTNAPPAYSQTYDPNGNRASQTTADNRVAFDGTYHYQYDDEGNRIARWQTTNSGETQPGTGDTDITIYAWDYRNRLTSVTHYQTFGGTADNSVGYCYDVFNRMVSEQQTIGGTLNEDYVYDGQNLQLVLDGSSGAVKERELWGPAVDQILASEDASGNVSWMLTDNQGTVRDVVQYNYDADTQTGATNLEDHLVYGAFGVISHQTPGAAQPRFTYTAERYDPATGLYYYKARWYDPATTGFVSQDPDGFAAGDANLNRYCGNSPTNYTDPSGLFGMSDVANFGSGYLHYLTHPNQMDNDLVVLNDVAYGMVAVGAGGLAGVGAGAALGVVGSVSGASASATATAGGLGGSLVASHVARGIGNIANERVGDIAGGSRRPPVPCGTASAATALRPCRPGSSGSGPPDRQV